MAPWCHHCSTARLRRLKRILVKEDKGQKRKKGAAETTGACMYVCGCSVCGWVYVYVYIVWGWGGGCMSIGRVRSVFVVVVCVGGCGDAFG